MKITKIIAGFILIFSLGACNSWLDVDLKDQVIEGELFTDQQGFHEALAGVYSSLSDAGLYGKTLSFETLDVFAQVYNYSTMNSSYEKYRDLVYTDANVEKKLTGVWEGMYRQIAALNNILLWLDKNGNVMPLVVQKQIKGESMALRAYLHFDLLRMFTPDVKLDPKADGIPYNKTFGVSLPYMYSVEEVVALVLNDLTEAADLLENDPIHDVVPYQLGNGQDENKDGADVYVARMNYFAVKALMARVYLAKGDKKKARETAEEVINSGKFRLVNYEESINGPADQKDYLFSDEHILSLRNKHIPEYSNALHLMSSSGGISEGAKLPMPGQLSYVYDNNYDDIRLVNWFSTGSQYLTKLTHDEQARFFPKMPLMKLSEMYLIAAEAWLNIDNEKCLQFVNDYRKSRIIGASDVNFMTQEGILIEYRREFIGEGQLFYAYKRMNSPIFRESAEGNIPAGEEVFVFPLPKTEIENGHRN